jgi:long-chain acyl-CoA synthetase
MLLTTNGQNIFPEEIEVILNTLPYVSESIVVQRNNHLVAIIVPDLDAIEHIDSHSLNTLMAENLKRLNEVIPAYEAVANYQLRFEPLEKTPKGSIKRYLYK